MLNRPLVSALLLCTLVVACETKKISSSVKPTDERSRRLTVLAAVEAGNIADGDAQAAAVLAKGGGWASAIEKDDERRSARLAFAVALFNLNAYEGGVATLQLERDAIWSSDTMLALAAPVPADKSRESFMNAYGR